MTAYTWHPGAGVDSAAVARLQAHFPRPGAPMGEAWFMGDTRRMFPELARNLSLLSVRDLEAPLAEIASGVVHFGALPEWHAWYHYLLAHLVARAHEAYVHPLLEVLVTCFMALYPDGVVAAPYPAFGEDVLSTLGRCMMQPSCWDGDAIVVGACLHRSNDNPRGVWRWWDASGDLSASLFLCLKYLPAEAIDGWLRSVLAIRAPHWRAQLLVWLVGAHALLHGQIGWPAGLPANAHPAVTWEWSHVLRNPDPRSTARWLPEANRQAALAVVAAVVSEDVYLDWLETIASVDYLAAELGNLPDQFEGLYLPGRTHPAAP